MSKLVDGDGRSIGLLLPSLVGVGKAVGIFTIASSTSASGAASYH